MIALLFCLSASVAAETEPSEEITVYGELEIRRARDVIVRDMEAMGWRTVRRGTSDVVFRPPRRWMGRAHLDREGNLRFTRPVVAFDGATAQAEIDVEDNPHFSRNDDHGTAAAGFIVLPAQRILDPVRAEVRRELQPELDAYQQVVRNTAVRARLDAVPDRLDALWERGEPLEGTTAITGATARRRAALDYWATRPGTPEGNAVSSVVETWLREVVMDSDDPVTDDEAAEAEARRLDGRSLQLR